MPLAILEWGRDSSLLSYFPLDGGTAGSIANNITSGFEDLSGNGHNGTAKNSNGSGMAWVSGSVGGGVSFDGTDDYVELPIAAHADVSNGSLVMWLNSRNVTTDRYVYSDEAGGASWLGLYFNATGLNAGFYNSGYSWQLLSQAVNVDTWYHVVITWSSSGAYMYLNGASVKTSAVTSKAEFAPSRISAGRYPGYYFDGSLDDIRVYNRALSAAEVSALYNATK
jgi:hypothetical protein